MLALHHMKAVLETPLKLRPKGLAVYLGCVAILLTVMTALILAVAGGRLPIDTRFIAATLCLNGFLAILLLLAHRDIQSRLTARIASHSKSAWLLLSLILLFYFAYALGTDSFRTLGFLKLAGYVLLPALLLLPRLLLISLAVLPILAILIVLFALFGVA